MSVKTPRLEDYLEWKNQNTRLQELNGRRDAAEKRVQELLSTRSEILGPMSGSERQEKARALTVGHSVEFKGRPQAHQVEAAFAIRPGSGRWSSPR
jgi:hypothetical protein